MVRVFSFQRDLAWLFRVYCVFFVTVSVEQNLQPLGIVEAFPEFVSPNIVKPKSYNPSILLNFPISINNFLLLYSFYRIAFGSLTQLSTRLSHRKLNRINNALHMPVHPLCVTNRKTLSLQIASITVYATAQRSFHFTLFSVSSIISHKFALVILILHRLRLYISYYRFVLCSQVRSGDSCSLRWQLWIQVRCELACRWSP